MKNTLKNTTAMLVMAATAMPLLAASVFAQDVGNDGATDSGRFILPYHGDINPFHGDIDPFHGDIDPFHGDINPFHGDIDPFYGDISPFWGDISPFWGDIDPFGGDIDPFHGDISPFWGDIDPFWGDIDPFNGDINPFWGDISPFWGDIGPFWGDINALWGDIDPFDTASAGDYNTLASQLNDMFARAESVFGAAVAAQDGASFSDAFLSALLAKYGMDPSDPESLSNVTAEDRSRFFLDFYDGLMGYSGIDRVDHWMPAINWSPARAQSVGSGSGVVVGLLDFSLQGDEGMNIRTSGGERDWLNFNHGAAVASLIAAPLDGHGVMGVAQGATLVTYNPFDESLSTNWEDVRDGVLNLVQHQARILNMSLGMPGWTLHQDWADVLSDHQVAAHANDTLFVVAAGNDGITQTADLDWSAVGSVGNLLVVGSVNPVGRISSFSNRPGDACLLVNGVCGEGYRLMDRFLVAPGELLLASDGEGGVIRLSGTSFAAPLVTGAAALVQGRWNWLGAPDVANVLLWSARDLGDPGVDAVYGWGMLDVGAALAPLNMEDLFVIDARGKEMRVRDLGIAPGRLKLHAADNATVSLFESLGDTFRDFRISYDELMNSADLSEAQKAAITEIYLAERTRQTGNGRNSFNDTGEYSRIMSRSGSLQVTAFASSADPRESMSNRDLPFQMGAEISDPVQGRSVRFGTGEGALALSSQTGFGLFSDHRPETGGVNPVLGFASGGGYMMTRVRLGEATNLSVGVTSTRDSHDFVNPFTGEETAIYTGMADYQATAFVADLNQPLSDSLSVHVSYTWLNEATGLLGAQGTGPLSFEGGARTDAVTMGTEARLPGALTLATSATLARTHSTSFDDSLLSLSEAAISTAYQVTMTRTGVFGGADALRLSIIQPLHLEDGTITYAATEVADRQSGDLGVVSDGWALGGTRAVYSELLYATPLFDGAASLDIFGRASLSGQAGSADDLGIASGARFRLEF